MASNLDAIEQKLVDDVARFGWHCMKVASRSDDPIQTTFAYSIGLEVSFAWPELICFGLEVDTLHALLAAAIDELREKKITPRAGLLLTNVVNDYPCRLDEFAASHHRDHLGWALWFAKYRGRDPRLVRCLQLMWPDRHGHFPDDPACIEDVRALQKPAVS